MFDESKKQKSLPEVRSDEATVEPGTLNTSSQNSEQLDQTNHPKGEEEQNELRKLREKHPPVYSTEHRFKNRELIRNAPDVPLRELFTCDGFTQEMVAALDKYGFVLGTGQQGIGKTEVILGQRGYGAKAGGIVDYLSEKGLNTLYLDLQGRTSKKLLVDLADGGPINELLMGRISKADIVAFDEAVGLKNDPKYAKGIFQLKELGKRMILIGGGDGTSAQQAEVIVSSLEHAGVQISSDQTFSIPPYLLTDDQAIELLKARATAGRRVDISDELLEARSREILELVRKANLPTIYRAIVSLPDPDGPKYEEHKGLYAQKELNVQLEYILGHIEHI